MHAPLKTAFLIILISFAIFSRLIFIVHAGEVVITLVGGNTAVSCEPTWQRANFNAQNRSWVFVCITRDFKDILTYSSSTDDITWENSYDDNGEPPLIADGADSWEFDIHYDGTYVHYVYDGFPDIEYMRGTPLTNGSIQWGDLQTAFTDSDPDFSAYNVKVGADDHNYPWIGYGWYDSPSIWQNWVTKSSINDGTWVTASGFPHQLGGNDATGVVCIPLGLGIGGLGNDDTYVLYAQENSQILYGRLWRSDSGWGNEETITNSLSGYDYIAVSAIAGYSHVWVAWSNDTKDLLFRERNYLTLWNDTELIADATSIEIYNASAVIPSVVIGIDGDATIHAFWVGTRDHTLGLGYKNRTISPFQWNEFEVLTTDTGSARDNLQCREKANEGIMAVTYLDGQAPISVNQWKIDAVTDWGDYEPPSGNPAIAGYIMINGLHDTIGLEFDIGNETYIDGEWGNIVIGNYTLNATSCLDDPDQHPFVSWSSYPEGENTIENTTNPTTNVSISASGHVTLHIQCLNETCPHHQEGINIEIRLEGATPPHNFDGVVIDGAGYRDQDTAFLLNGTYDLSAYLASYGFTNWATTDAGGEHFFGNKTIGGYNTTTPMNQKTAAYGTSYNLDRRATVTKIWLYCWASADVQKGTCGIYSIEGHDIENAVLMGSTQELTGINTTAMWRNFTFTGGLALEAGDYAITIHAGDISAGLRGKYDAETGSHFQGNVPDTYADGLSNPFGSGGSNLSNCYVSVYAEYSYDLIYVHNLTEETTYLTIYGNGTLTLNLYKLPDMMNLYTWIAMLLAALFLMIWSPSWFAWKIKKVGVTTESIERLGYAMLLFLVGFGLLVMCIYA
ncbi:hypothetical protein ES702_02558 [subsurface metagenome]